MISVSEEVSVVARFEFVLSMVRTVTSVVSHFVLWAGGGRSNAMKTKA